MFVFFEGTLPWANPIILCFFLSVYSVMIRLKSFDLYLEVIWEEEKGMTEDEMVGWHH